MGMVNVPVNPVTNLDNAAGIVMLPQQVDRLVAVRTPNSSVKIQGLEHFYRIDWDAFCSNGVPSTSFAPNQMSILNPVWLTVRPATYSNVAASGTYSAGAIVINSTNNSGPNANGTYIYNAAQNLFIGPTGYTISPPNNPPNTVAPGNFVLAIARNTGYQTIQAYSAAAANNNWTVVNLTTCSSTGGFYITVPTVIGQLYKLTTGQNDYGFTGAAAASGSIFYFIATSATTNIYGLESAAFTGILQTSTVNLLATYNAGVTVTISSDNPADYAAGTAATVKVTWRDSTDRYTTTAVLPITVTPADAQGVIEIESVFKPATQGNLTVTINDPLPASRLIGSLAPTVLQSPSFQRLRIFPVPTAATTLNVLGKKPFVPLAFPTEIPAIRNLDNCLIAFAMGDMLERARQFGKAQQQYTEAAALLKGEALAPDLAG